MRLWRVDGSTPRDGRSILQGGDYIPSGWYTPEELGFPNGSAWNSARMLYAEAVRESTLHEARIDVSVVAYRPGDPRSNPSPGEGCLLDTVGVTTTRIQVLRQELGATEFTPYEIFAPITTRNPTLPPLPPGLIDGTYGIYKIIIRDPRELAGTMRIAGQPLFISRITGVGTPYYESEEFYCIDPARPPSAPPRPGIDAIWLPPGNDVEIEYNPRAKTKKGAATLPLSVDAEFLITLINNVIVLDMETQNWDGSSEDPGDPGAFGKEVHKRVGQRLQGIPDWHSNVIVEKLGDNGPYRIVRIGGDDPPGTGRIQIDAFKSRPGYAPVVGQNLDIKQIEELFEIKTGVAGRIEPAQRQALEALMEGRGFTIPMSKRRWTPTIGWNFTPKVAKKLRLGRIVGRAVGVAAAAQLVTPVWALVSHSQYDEELDEAIRAADAAKRETNEQIKPLLALEAIEKAVDYFTHFNPDPSTTPMIKLAVFYHYYGSPIDDGLPHDLPDDPPE